SCDLVDGDRERSLEIPVREVSDIQVSPDGRTVAVSSYRSSEIILRDIEAGRTRMILQGHSSPVFTMAFSPDGRSLASTANLHRSALLGDLDTGRSRRLQTGAGGLSVSFSPDSRLLATVNAREKGVRIWDVPTGRPLALIAGDSEPVLSAAFSTDGQLL